MLKHPALLVIAFLAATGAVAVAVVAPRPFVAAIIGGPCDGEVCTDEPARLPEARKLYEDAFESVSSSISPLEARPLVVFCASEKCYRSFGFSDASAKSVGSFLIVIGPRAWKPFYLRHEFIHRLQAQQLGSLRMYQEPRWLIEGMAYSLSGDPRRPLDEPFETDRSTFDAWYLHVGIKRLWTAAKMVP